jgi:cation transport protein ChaC
MYTEGMELVLNRTSRRRLIQVWNPPCDASRIIESFPCKVEGFHRRFWQSSTDHRGTFSFPGRVVTILEDEHRDVLRLGLGSGCIWGMCFRIRGLSEILPDLDFRERHGYTRTVAPVRGADGSALGRAVLYFAKPGDDPAYIGPEADEATALTIHRAVGPSGPNLQYLLQLHHWCIANRVPDTYLDRLVHLTQHVK